MPKLREPEQSPAQRFIDEAEREGQIKADIERLAKLSPALYAVERRDQAKQLGMSVGDLDTLVKRARQWKKTEKATTEKATAEADQIKINPVEMLDSVFKFLGRFIAYPSEDAQVAHCLWCVHAHLMDEWDSTPRIAFLSPEPKSGKTRALEITELLVPFSVEAVNVSPAYLFRKVGNPDGRATILYDEIDTVFGPKAKENEEIRGILNAGHRKGAVAGRCVTRGNVIETEELPAYAAVALAGLGWLPDTILTRSIIIRMRRRKSGEKVEPYRRRIHGAEGNRLRDQLAAWAMGVAGTITETWPEMPKGIEDRDADCWESLIAIADSIGGDWPKRVRVAAVALVAASQEAEASLGIRLLTDLKTIFTAEAMFTVNILAALKAMEDSPWQEVGLNGRGLAQHLRQYGVKKSSAVRSGDNVGKGYYRRDMLDAWARYVVTDSDPEDPPSLSSGKTVTRVTRVTNPDFAGVNVTDVTDRGVNVTDQGYTEKPNKTNGMPQSVTDVTDVTLSAEDGERYIPRPSNTPTVETPYLHRDCEEYWLRERAPDTPTHGMQGVSDVADVALPDGEACAQCGRRDPRPAMVVTATGTVYLHRDCEEYWFRSSLTAGSSTVGGIQ
jgi:hypothetical protein